MSGKRGYLSASENFWLGWENFFWKPGTLLGWLKPQGLNSTWLQIDCSGHQESNKVWFGGIYLEELLTPPHDEGMICNLPVYYSKRKQTDIKHLRLLFTSNIIGY